MRVAGQALAAAGVGAGLGAGGLALVQHLAEQGTPVYAREMTQEEHAKNNIGGYRERFPKVKPQELALYEGIRQALMAGEMSGSELNTLVLQGKIPDRVVNMLVDVHDFSADQPYPFGQQTIYEANLPGQLG